MNPSDEMLFDKFRQRKDFTDCIGLTFSLVHSLDECESKVFEVTNVAQYFASLRPLHINSIYDVFPPFDTFWMEFQLSGLATPTKGAVLWRVLRNDDGSGWTCCTQFFHGDKDQLAMMPIIAEFVLTSGGNHEG